MEPTLKAGLVILFSAVVGYGFARFGRGRDRNQEAEDAKAEAVVKQNEEIALLRQQLAVLTATATPLTAAYQAMLIAKLTHFHTPAMDSLMLKLGPPSTLTAAEEIGLAQALRERVSDMGPEIDEAERTAARLLPDVALLARLEFERVDNPPETETVVVTRPVTENEQFERGGKI